MDLYCDDELRMSLEYDEHHLGLGLSEVLAFYDLLDADLLPTTATRNLEVSLDKLSTVLENSNCGFGRHSVPSTREA